MLLMTLKSVKLTLLERGLWWPPASFFGLEWHRTSFRIFDFRLRFLTFIDSFLIAFLSEERLQTFESKDIIPLRSSLIIELRQLIP